MSLPTGCSKLQSRPKLIQATGRFRAAGAVQIFGVFARCPSLRIVAQFPNATGYFDYPYFSIGSSNCDASRDSWTVKTLIINAVPGHKGFKFIDGVQQHIPHHGRTGFVGTFYFFMLFILLNCCNTVGEVISSQCFTVLLVDGCRN